MANTFKVKRSAVAGKAPTTTDLALGELAINTHDGKLYFKRDDGVQSILVLDPALADKVGDIGAVLDAINGEVI